MEWLYTTSGHIDLKWILTAAVALYGAVLATYREIAARREKTPDVRIKFFTTMMILDQGTSTPHVQLRINNHGRVEMSFDSNCASIQVKGLDTHFLLWQPITDVRSWPTKLTHGQSFYMSAATKPLRDAFADKGLVADTKIRAVVNDAIGRRFFSAWTTLPPVIR